MRALRVIGLDETGSFVVCEDRERGERFQIVADEHLRAAARGDVTRLGQIEIELESQMRPREIQARIRAGESVEQVATAAALPLQRVERFAYPVLLERSRTAELAQRAHPIREDGPDVQTLTEVAAHAFGVRGQDYSGAEWDSWRGEDSRWVVQLRWRTGRSDNHAHWAFSPGAHGGTVLPLDEQADQLLDPTANFGLRRVDRRGAPGREPEFLGQDDPVEESDGQPIPHGDPILAPPVELVGPRNTPAETHLPDESPQRTVASSATEPTTAQPERPREDAGLALDVKRTPEAEPATTRKGKKNHPTVPSWEDVLLGVRSSRG
ncbi:MAG: septation protein SepH [Sciscionella sp.]